jgi:hypothetical protein
MPDMDCKGWCCVALLLTVYSLCAHLWFVSTTVLQLRANISYALVASCRAVEECGFGFLSCELIITSLREI